MGWPLSQDYNEAIQSPQLCCADADLRAGRVAVNRLGLPLPRSGNFADVYEVLSPDGGRRWAVKCFTRQVPGLRERYAAVSAHLRRARPRFAVDFQFLEQGIRVAGRWYPALKMEWVEGLLLNEFVRDALDKPPLLEALADLWVRLAHRLRRAGLAHGDLQHGNVLLVPGRDERHLALKLIDYDGMWVPALAGSPSGEVGHPAYQHPRRLREATYSAEVDRFPLLVVYVAVRALVAGGRPLWDRYDNGDNLLFRERDLRSPRDSALFRDLVRLPDPEVRRLADRLSRAVYKPPDQVPLLEELVPYRRPAPAEQPARPAATAGVPGVEESPTAPAQAEGATQPGQWPGENSRTRLLVVSVLAVVVTAVVALTVLLALSGKPAVPTKEALGARSPVATGGRETRPAEAAPPPGPEGQGQPQLPQGPEPPPEPRAEPKPELPPEAKPAVAPPDDAGQHGEPEIENSIGMKLALIPAGRFQMGSPPEEKDRAGNEEPRHWVEISRPFYLGVYAVTQEEYLKVTGTNPSYFSRGGKGKNQVADQDTMRFPVEQVSWDDAVKFCQRLSALEQEQRAGRTYRLPTEAGWEYACRAGTATRFSFGEKISAKDANFDATQPYGGVNKEVAFGGGEQGPRLGRTTAVGSYRKNAFGLYDMHGNVYQWCNDWHDEDYYKVSPGKDPQGPVRGQAGERSMRGGTWHDPAWNCRSACRSRNRPEVRGYGLGFRVVCVVRPPGEAPGGEPVVKAAPNPGPKPEPKAEPKPEPNPGKAPVPAEAAQAQAEKAIKDVFKAEYAKRRPADWRALAAKLLQQAKETKADPAARFVLLREARDLAANAADPVLALRAVEEMARDFAVDALGLKVTALEAAGQSATTPGGNGAVVVSSLATADECLAADDFGRAARLVKVAENAAAKTKATKLSAYVRGRAKEVDALGAEYERVKPATAVLRWDPKDPSANLAVGRYTCLGKCDWAKGLPLLAAGTDGDLKELARKELAAPAGGAGQVELADGWRAFGEGEAGTARAHALLRAYYWYQQGAASLEGFPKARAEKSITDLEKALPAEELVRVYEGKWVISYANKTVRTYVFDARGNALDAEASRRASLARVGGHLLLDFGDGKLERVRLADGKLQVEQFDPTSKNPTAPSTTGVGVRQP
jgi:formylglycine-generating enzyme required for sulfatase activity